MSTVWLFALSGDEKNVTLENGMLNENLLKGTSLFSNSAT